MQYTTHYEGRGRRSKPIYKANSTVIWEVSGKQKVNFPRHFLKLLKKENSRDFPTKLLANNSHLGLHAMPMLSFRALTIAIKN